MSDDRGSAAVEFAFVLPVIVLLVVAILQIGGIVQTQLLLTNAAREGARAAAVRLDPNEAVEAARAVLPTVIADGARITVERQAEVGGRARVTVSYRRWVFKWLGDSLAIPLSSSAEMRVER